VRCIIFFIITDKAYADSYFRIFFIIIVYDRINFLEKFCPKEKLLTNNAIAKNFDEVFIVSFFVGLKNYFDTKM
jgi:hypothetical protein